MLNKKNIIYFILCMQLYSTIHASSDPELQNNSTQNINNLLFFNEDQDPLNNPVYLNPNASILIPIETTSIQGSVFGTTMTQVISDSNSSNFFGAGSIVNQTGISLYVNFYTTDSVLINTPQLYIANDTSLPIPITATSVTLYNSNNTLALTYSLYVDNTYYITYGNGSYTVSWTGTTAYTLTNNYNQAITNLTFYDDTNSQISNPITFNSNSFINIPTNSTTVSGSVFGVTITQAISTSSSSNFYGAGMFTNNSSSTIFINFYNNSDLVINSAPITVAPYVMIPIVTGATAISTMTSLNPLVYAVPGSQINANNNYSIIENNEIYEIIQN